MKPWKNIIYTVLLIPLIVLFHIITNNLLSIDLGGYIIKLLLEALAIVIVLIIIVIKTINMLIV